MNYASKDTEALEAELVPRWTLWVLYPSPSGNHSANVDGQLWELSLAIICRLFALVAKPVVADWHRRWLMTFLTLVGLGGILLHLTIYYHVRMVW